MRRLDDLAVREESDRDCTDPGSFASYNEAYSALKLHDAHGPQCQRHLAATAFVAAEHD